MSLKYLQSYKDCHELAQTHKRKLANNTYLQTNNQPTSYEIRLYETNIVTYYKTGKVVLDSGGWRTTTTKTRINDYTPSNISLFQNRSIWYVQVSGHKTIKTYSYANGFTFTITDIGIVKSVDKRTIGADPKVKHKLGRQIAKYATDYLDQLSQRKLGGRSPL